MSQGDLFTFVFGCGVFALAVGSAFLALMARDYPNRGRPGSQPIEPFKDI